jgi:o-succinylbenzoate---CoA ligase
MFVLQGQKPIFPYEKTPYLQIIQGFVEKWQSQVPTFELHTSGSTGTPKAIWLSRTQMEASARATGRFFGFEKGQKILLCLDPRFIAGTMMLVRGLVWGLDMYLVPPTQHPFDELPEHLELDFVALVPMQLQQAVQVPTKLKKIKNILVGGAAVGQSLLQEIQKVDTPIWASYGMTETVSHIAIQRLNGPERQDYFTILPEVKIQQNERNCLAINGPMTDFQWVQTNDVVEILSPNTFRLLGRVDNIINSGGIKIQLEQVENLLEKSYRGPLPMPRFFAWGIPDDFLGQKLCIFVESSPFEVTDWWENTPWPSRYHRPKQAFFVPTFEETPSHKIDKLKTIQLHAH